MYCPKCRTELYEYESKKVDQEKRGVTYYATQRGQFLCAMCGFEWVIMGYRELEG